MIWFCPTCGNQALKKKGRRHLWCSFCMRLRVVHDLASMQWYEAEAKRILAGRKMPADYPIFNTGHMTHGDQA